MNDDATLLALLDAESSFSAIRAQGAGGQNVNKVSSAVHLRFDIAASSLPDAELAFAGQAVMVTPPGHQDPASHAPHESPPGP